MDLIGSMLLCECCIIALKGSVVTFQVTIMDTGVRGTIAVGLVPQFYKLDHQPGWLPHSIAYHADDGK